MDWFRWKKGFSDSGAHLRHDTLAGVDRISRQVLMTYFIGSNTPGKLDPQDRKLYVDIEEQ